MSLDCGCNTGLDIGIPEYANTISHRHPRCTRHYEGMNLDQHIGHMVPVEGCPDCKHDLDSANLDLV
jgi:hypothetical protein